MFDTERLVWRDLKDLVRELHGNAAVLAEINGYYDDGNTSYMEYCEEWDMQEAQFRIALGRLIQMLMPKQMPKRCEPPCLSPEAQVYANRRLRRKRKAAKGAKMTKDELSDKIADGGDDTPVWVLQSDDGMDYARKGDDPKPLLGFIVREQAEQVSLTIAKGWMPKKVTLRYFIRHLIPTYGNNGWGALFRSPAMDAFIIRYTGERDKPSVIDGNNRRIKWGDVSNN